MSIMPVFIRIISVFEPIPFGLGPTVMQHSKLNNFLQ